MLSRVSFRSLAATFVSLLALAGRSAAQCGPDGLDGATTCLSPTSLSLQQAGFKSASLGICWQNCGVLTTANYTAQWSALAPTGSMPGTVPSCGWYTANLTLLQGAGIKWFGTFHFSYSRTWMESAAPKTYQVWRYLINGDLRPAAANPGPCGMPPCAPPFANKVRFTGYVDYAIDCAIPGAVWEQSWMITHACDAIDHAPGFPRAGVYHPSRFYTFVGPRLGFTVGTGATLENGPATVEAIRAWDASALPARCQHEEPLLFGSFSPNATLCLCGTGPAQWYEAFFNGAGAFGASVSPFPGSDPFRSFPIGTWTNSAAYPGVEELRWNANELLYVECTGVGRQEYYFGVTTAGGYAPFGVGPGGITLPSTFIDQSNSVILPANVATRNRPYRSDHVLNLNL